MMTTSRGRPQIAAPRKRCVVYTRSATSCPTQTADSCIEQRDLCGGHIQAQPGWELIDDGYDDRNSGGLSIERTEMQRLLVDARARRCDVVVVSRLDRLARSVRDLASVLDQLERAGVDVVAVAENFSTATAAGRSLLLTLKIQFAGLFAVRELEESADEEWQA